MWLWLVSHCPHMSFDNCRKQGFSIPMSNYGLTCRSTRSCPKLYCFKICSNFHSYELFNYLHSPYIFFLFARENSSATAPPQCMRLSCFYGL